MKNIAYPPYDNLGSRAEPLQGSGWNPEVLSFNIKRNMEKKTPEKLVSRLAPTPSGLLHLGNAVNFILTWLLVRRENGILHLRIDDLDGLRAKREFVEDIFSSLSWLGLDWDFGPSDPGDFYACFSQMDRMDFYRKSAEKLLCDGFAYVCTCSRKEIAAISDTGLYPGICRKKGLSFEAGVSSIRLFVPEQTRISLEEKNFLADEEFGDFVLWRKEDLAAYHLVSVLEDEAMGVNLVVRGEDLYPSSCAQIFLAEKLGLEQFPLSRFVHHGLVSMTTGEKLSKSKNSLSLSEMRKSGAAPSDIFRFVAKFLHMEDKKIQSLKDLQNLFDEKRHFPQI